MTSHVVDASAMGPVILAHEATNLFSGLMEIMTDTGALVPQHWRLEVANMGRMAVLRNRLTDAELERSLAAASAFRITIDGETGRHAWTRTMALAARHGLTVYDAAYLELAARARLPLATLDGALARAAASESVVVLAS